ncbi:MAG: CPBP family intramembrane metalloprotease [Anaerolineae bacterium]|nr:CPBP family intramembrane metalloprotease [Anaerolineae bacterium]
MLLLLVSGFAYNKLRQPYQDMAMTAMRLTMTAALLVLTWRMGWLQGTGIARLGGWQVWLLAGIGLLYFSGAALYAFYGKVAFDFSSLIHLPASRAVIYKQFVVGIYEEILFRGVILYVLISAWGNTRLGVLASVALTAALFAFPHIFGVLMGTSWQSALLLVLEGTIIAIWWGALVLWGGSIWPAVILHFVVNALVEVQGLTVPMVAPEVLAYQRFLWSSVPLGIAGVGLLLRNQA